MEEYPGNYVDHLIVGEAPPIVDFKEGVMKVYFPTPSSSKIIPKTRRAIKNCLQKHSPDKIEINLMGNVGGSFHIFFDSLRPLMLREDVIISGVDRYGNISYEVREIGEIIQYNIDGVIFNHNLMKCDEEKRKEYSKKTTAVVNKKSVSSSQIISLLCNEISGFSHDDLTNMCGRISKGIEIPMYRFMKNGYLYEGLHKKTPYVKNPKKVPEFESLRDKFYGLTVAKEKPSYPIDDPDPVSDEHLFSILRYNNTTESNMHFRTSFTLSKFPPVFKNGTLFMPDFVGFESVSDNDYLSNEDKARRISIAYGPVWDKIETWLKTNKDITIDCRGFRQRGVVSVMCFWPFLDYHTLETDNGTVVLNPKDIKSPKKKGDALFKCNVTLIVDDLVCRYHEKYNVLILDYFLTNHKIIGRGPCHKELREFKERDGYKILKKTHTLKKPFMVRSVGSYLHEDIHQ